MYCHILVFDLMEFTYCHILVNWGVTDILYYLYVGIILSVCMYWNYVICILESIIKCILCLFYALPRSLIV